MFSPELFTAFSTHNGVLSSAELGLLGLTPMQISRRYKAGLLSRPYPGVYRLCAWPDDWLSNARALALSTNGLISHRSAAVLWGFDERVPPAIEVTVPYGRSLVRDGAIVHRSKQYDLADPHELDKVPVTGPARTILDCAAKYGPREFEFLVDAVIRQKVLDWPDLFDVQIRHSAKGRDGTGKLRLFLDARSGARKIPDSMFNRMVGRLLEDAGLGAPSYEFEVRTTHDAFVARVDLAYPSLKLAIELDSIRYHFNHESFVRDPRRKNALQLEGWTVLTFTWADYSDTPRQLVHTVRSQLTNLKAG